MDFMNYMVKIIDVIYAWKISFINKNHYIVAFPPTTLTNLLFPIFFDTFWKLKIMHFKTVILFLFLLNTTITEGQHKLTLEPLSSEINSSLYDEIAPIVSHDGQTIYFTRVGHPNFDKTLEVNGKDMSLTLSPSQYDVYLANIYSRISGTRIRNAGKSAYNQDVWIAQFKDNEFQTLHHPGPPLNNALPNSICALTPDDDAFLVLNQFLPGGGMNEGFSIIQKNGTDWSFPKPVQIENYYTTGKDVNVTMSPDGEVLIMSLKRAGGYGQNDLYVSFKNEVGGWTEPMNLGKNINSKLSEDTPTISEDKKTIYFSSNRTNTMGGRDIFRSRRNSDNWTDWAIPRRFIAPINSNQDDSQPCFNDRTGYLYFTSNRAGSADIYRVRVANPKRDEVLIKGKIINASTNEPMAGKVLYGPNDLGHFLRYFKSKDGAFEFRIPKGQTFKVCAEQADFLSPQQTIITKKGKYYPTQEITLLMTPIQADMEIQIAPIYFKQSESSILTKSYAALDNLLKILQDNESMHIQIDGHTEKKGDAQFLLDLSEARAFAIKRYLMDKGIDSERLATKGYGGTRPVKISKREDLRQKNRRVEIRITRVE